MPSRNPVLTDFPLAIVVRTSEAPPGPGRDPLHAQSAVFVRDDGANQEGSRLANFRIPLIIGAVLFASGGLHLIALWVTGGEWEGPVSLRKPGLFGVSAGVTVWSLAWVLTQLQPRRFDRRLALLMSGGLLLEVTLITVQQWRGVPSHFNHSTLLDSGIESTMLVTILLVTGGIAWLCWRSRWLQPMPESQAIAVRAGLWLLLISCGLGGLATIIGEMNVDQGRAPEVWGPAGVLKYPHGAALHAVQLLPLLSALLRRVWFTKADRLLRAAVIGQLLFLAHAVWQTFHGRARLDVDFKGIAFLAVVGLVLILLDFRLKK